MISTNQQLTRPIQQAFFPSVTHSTTGMAIITSNSNNSTITSEDIFLTTLKQSSNSVKSNEQKTFNNTPNETKIVHKSLFDAISSTQRVKI